MSADRDVTRIVRSWLHQDAHEDADRILNLVLDEIDTTPQRRANWQARRLPPVNSNFVRAALAVAVVVLVAIVGYQFLGNSNIGGPDATETPQPTPVQVAPGAGTRLGWSSDGTRLLIQKDLQNLFILHADGSETQVTDQLSGFNDIPGSGRPAGATISPDGSRVVFAGLTREGSSCHYGALFTVDADGGSAEVLWESPPGPARGPTGGIVRYPRFSPDGTQIAFADGYCDHDHSVWVMNADGSDPHQIVYMDQAGHVYGLAWSPAGDRIALQFEGATYTFATDGSDFTQVSAAEYCWPSRLC